MTEEPKKRNLYGSPLALGGMIVLAVLVYRTPEIIQALRGPVTTSPVTPPATKTDWSALVPEESDREQLAAYLDAYVALLPWVRDLGHFHTARKIGDPALQTAAQLSEQLAAFDKELARRLELAMGELDPGKEDLKPLAAELTQIAQELRGS